MPDAKSWIAAPLGHALSRDERAFFGDERPWGFILFARHVASEAQLADLVAELKEAGGRETTPIFVDQEGGRIQRLRPPFADRMPAAGEIGKLYRNEPEQGLRAAYLHGRLLSAGLDRYGINANCIPCLDLPIEGAHDIIGDRALGTQPAAVAALGRAMAEGAMAAATLPVMKHMPGHGRGRSDSHVELPMVDTKHAELARTDFQPFADLADLPAAMTAHILYTDIDPERCGTLSPIVVEEIIRGEIGFDGLLMTDDLSMKALKGSFKDRTAAAFSAGCDIALHCNGEMDEMRAIASATRPLSGKGAARAAIAESVLSRTREVVDLEELRAEYHELMSVLA